jgi:hypothetical protein
MENSDEPIMPSLDLIRKNPNRSQKKFHQQKRTWAHSLKIKNNIICDTLIAANFLD